MLNPKLTPSKKPLKSPKIPLNLKNPNISSSFSSSCSISSDVPSGCLRFLSNVSKNSNKNPKFTPKGSNFRLNGVKKGVNEVKSSNDALDVVKVRKFSRRYDLFDDFGKKSDGFEVKFSGNSEKLRKNSKRCDLSDEIGKKPSRVRVIVSDNGKKLIKNSSKCDFSDEIGVKFTDNGKNPRKSSSKCEFSNEIGVKFSDNGKNPRKNSKRYDLCDEMGKNLSGRSDDFTPNSKCDGVSRSPTPPPPIQSSVSPEIQCGLTSVVAETPATCYAAGHVMSGVTDKRKCRPKGILTIGNNNLFGSCRPSTGFRSEGDRRDSIVPCPIEAFVCWITSPCDEKRSGDGDEKLSSASSSLGFSSEVFDKSNCTMSTDVSSGSYSSSSRSKSFVLDSDMSSEFRGVLGPSLDHLVRSPSPLSPVAMSDLEDSLGSGNVMQTPESISSPCNPVLVRSWSECELDSVNISPDCLIRELDSPRPSFEFNPLVKLDSSNDLILSGKAMNMACIPDTSDSLLRSSPEPDVRLSWGETDELDCCRYLSDEDDTTDRP